MGSSPRFFLPLANSKAREKAGSKDAFEKANFRYQLPDEFSDSQRKELQTSDLRLYPMKRKA
jgi:hypothetical protein